MRHRKGKGRISRRTSWRKATLKSLANDLFTYQRIETTMAKAKALRSFAEPLITLAKKSPDSVTARRRAFQKLCDKDVVKSLFDELGPLYKDIPGGYTRIMPLGNRKGDGAQLVIMELTKRTISDEDLLGITKEKELAKRKKKKEEKAPKEAAEEKVEHAAPEVEPEEKEERAVEEVKKEKAKTEQKKVEKKGEKRGFFRRFQRKSFGPSQ
ncbi:MAG: 50S ribosomal protein L17 [Candidatus Omnitrophota bacterium]